MRCGKETPPLLTRSLESREVHRPKKFSAELLAVVRAAHFSCMQRLNVSYTVYRTSTTAGRGRGGNSDAEDPERLLLRIASRAIAHRTRSHPFSGRRDMLGGSVGEVRPRLPRSRLTYPTLHRLQFAVAAARTLVTMCECSCWPKRTFPRRPPDKCWVDTYILPQRSDQQRINSITSQAHIRTSPACPAVFAKINDTRHRAFAATPKAIYHQI
jgi:hypothetical protein